VRESRTPGSARGAGSNSRPYRNSREINLDSGADAVCWAEGNTDGRAIASVRPTRRGLRTWHARTLFARKPGDLPFTPMAATPRGRIGKARSRSR
jgi:hypothetical protein